MVSLRHPSHFSLKQALQFLKTHGIPYSRSLLIALANEFDGAFAEGMSCEKADQTLQGVFQKSVS
jgi:hypothetical protein